MNIGMLMKLYATSDKEKFPCMYPEWNEKRENTSFFADLFVGWRVGGISGIRDTYESAFSSWKTNVKYMTELTGALNHLLWESYSEMGDCEISREFDRLWKKCNAYCLDTFKEQDIEFYLAVLD